ncbi:MAG: hypothetical protein ABI778_10510 [Ignavibacteriota bacterium]
MAKNLPVKIDLAVDRQKILAKALLQSLPENDEEMMNLGDSDFASAGVMRDALKRFIDA